MLRNACNWRGLPEEFGKWITVYQYFNRLSHAGFFDYLKSLFCSDPDAEVLFGDSTHIKAHQFAMNSPQSIEDQCIGKSRGGMNTKLHLLVDGLGKLAELLMTGGNVNDHKAAPELVAKARDCTVVMDKGYDSKELRMQIREQGGEPCIPCRENVKAPEEYDQELYKSRHCVENFFQRLKVFKRCAMRCEKTSRMFLAFVMLAVSVIYAKDGLLPQL